MNYLSFALSLSLMCDVYRVYSTGIKILQTVDILPHTKMDSFHAAVIEVYEEMAETFDIAECPCSLFRDIPNKKYSVDYSQDPSMRGTVGEVCLWPSYHADIADVRDHGTFMGAEMEKLAPATNNTRAGFFQRGQNQNLTKDVVIKQADKRALEVVKFLGAGLEQKVFDAESVKDIETLRRVLDSASLLQKIKSTSPAAVSAVAWDKFWRAAAVVDEDVEGRIGKVELRLQFKEYCRRLDQMSSLSSSHDIFKKFFEPSSNMSSNIEGVLSIIAKAAVAKTVESVVESWISVLERHSSKVRNLKQDRIEDEMMTTLNGPEVVHCKSLVEEAMRKYWQKSRTLGYRDGHFVMKSGRIKSYLVSKAVDSVQNTPALRPFMLQ